MKYRLGKSHCALRMALEKTGQERVHPQGINVMAIYPLHIDISQLKPLTFQYDYNTRVGESTESLGMILWRLLMSILNLNQSFEQMV